MAEVITAAFISAFCLLPCSGAMAQQSNGIDADKIRDVASYEDPHHFSEGVIDVIVNGAAVLRDGQMTEALPGRALRRQK